MSRFLHYEACENCRERGKDSRGDNLARYSDGGGHCFSCGMHIHVNVQNHWANRKDIELDNKVKRILPDDFTCEVPSRAWEWILQYGLPYDYWKGIVGWSEKYQRLVFRIGDPLSFSIGRAIQPLEGRGEQSLGFRKWHVWGDSHGSVQGMGAGGSITLVEDILSAHKIYQSGNQVVCLFGTRIYPIHLEYLRQQNKSILVWLDNDQLDTMPRVCSNLSLLTGLNCEYISTTNDPKELSIRDINNHINRSS